MVNRQILRQLALRGGQDLDVRVWSLLDPPSDPKCVADRLGCEPFRLQWTGFSGRRTAMVMRALLDGARSDVVLSTHVGLAPVARLLARGGARHAQFLHGIECWDAVSMRSMWGLGSVDLFVSNSAYTWRRFATAHPGFARTPHRVCWLGVPWHDQRESASGDEEPSTVLIVGRFGPERYKGHDRLIRVWPRVLEHCPDARLDIVGGGVSSEELREAARRGGLEERGRIRFWGALSDEELNARYRDCSVFAMPSGGEGFGIVYAEAMAHRKPCIAQRGGAAEEIVEDGVTGLLVHEDDDGGLASAIVALLMDAATRRRMGEAGYERVRRDFTERMFGERLLGALGFGDVRSWERRSG